MFFSEEGGKIMNQSFDWDVIVVGVGPAGLTAALYTARYHRRVLVVHDGKSRALRILLTHNAPGFPDGDLIQRMTRRAAEYGTALCEAFVEDIKRTDGAFSLITDKGEVIKSRSVILSTGIFLNEVDLPRDVHEQAIKDDVLRYCPICDAYEHTDKSIDVLGCDSNGAAEALLLRRYSDRITLMPLAHPELSASQRAKLEEAGIEVTKGALVELIAHEDRMDVRLEGQEAASV